MTSLKAKDHHAGADKMCAMTCCSCDLDVKDIIPMVNKPKFICKSCGHVANDKKNLCQPKAI